MNNRRERERKRRDSMQEQGNFVAPQVERIDNDAFLISRGRIRILLFEQDWTKLGSASSTDLTKGNRRGRKEGRKKTRQKRRRRRENNSDVLSRCVLQSTKLFLTFRIFYRHNPFDVDAPTRAFRRISKCDSSRERMSRAL